MVESYKKQFRFGSTFIKSNFVIDRILQFTFSPITDEFGLSEIITKYAEDIRLVGVVVVTEKQGP